jgi:DNA polymerase III delta subunit
MTIDPRVARLVADRIGSDVSRLRPDVERLLLYASGSGTVTEADVKEVIRPASPMDDWGMTRAIERGSAADALRELAAIIENGAVPYMILGQLAWFARSKVPAPRVSTAVDAVFRTDLAIKTSAGDPRMLLEKLVVELCAR